MGPPHSDAPHQASGNTSDRAGLSPRWSDPLHCTAPSTHDRHKEAHKSAKTAIIEELNIRFASISADRYVVLRLRAGALMSCFIM